MSLFTPLGPSAPISTHHTPARRSASVGGRIVGLLLQPAMRIAHAQFTSERSSAPQPVDAPRGHGRGSDPDRVLLFSSQEFAGSGVVSHQLALAGQLADEVSQATRRGTDVDLSVPKRRRIRKASQSICGSELEKYDAVVVALGESDAFALTPPGHWSSAMQSLLDQIRSRSLAGTPIVVTGVPAIIPTAGLTSRLSERAQRHAALLDQATERLCAQSQNTVFVSLPPSRTNGAIGAAAAFSESARRIARQLVPKLPAPGLNFTHGALTARNNRSMPQTLLGRRQALLDLGVRLAGSDEQLDRVVDLARTYFGAHYAALVLSDGDSLRLASKAGFRGHPDLTKLAAPTLEAGRPVLVGNTSPANNSLFSLNVGGTDMGFYAGYPIEAPNGHRVGVLSVFDPKPRPVRASNTIVLRDLALMLQRELWAIARRKDDDD